MNNHLISFLSSRANVVLRRTARILVAVTVVLTAGPVLAQRAYPSAEAAANAFTDAVTRNDKERLNDILGREWRKFIPIQDIDPQDIHDYLAAWAQSHRINEPELGHAVLEVGEQGWTLPIPIVKQGVGWRFDVRAGADEMRTRRIGRNELDTMQALLAYYDAQKEYASVDRDSDGVLQYAQKFRSSKGTHDGLYWPTEGNDPKSPLGSLFAELKPGEGYHGYHYRILTTQGASASGGAYSYLIKGRMVSGFALIAWPIRYGETGVKSFIISHDGKVYEKDLGKNSSALAQRAASFNPDSGWQAVPLPEPVSQASQRASPAADTPR